VFHLTVWGRALVQAGSFRDGRHDMHALPPHQKNTGQLLHALKPHSVFLDHLILPTGQSHRQWTDSDAKLELATLPPLLILPPCSQNTASHCTTRHKHYLESFVLLVGHRVLVGMGGNTDIGMICNPFLKEVLTSYF
jgi:hypothetical protein